MDGRPGVMTILGNPATKKNSPRILKRRNGVRFVAPSAASVAWTEYAVLQLNRQTTGKTQTRPVHVEAHFYRKRNVGDLDNYCSALGDALQKARVIENDKQIKSWDGTRLHVDAVRPRIELAVWVME